MQDYGYWNPIEDTHREILSEIAAGELDENYLIKHSGDYGKCTSADRLDMLRAVIANLLDRIGRRSRLQPVGKSNQTAPKLVAH